MSPKWRDISLPRNEMKLYKTNWWQASRLYDTALLCENLQYDPHNILNVFKKRFFTYHLYFNYSCIHFIHVPFHVFQIYWLLVMLTFVSFLITKGHYTDPQILVSNICKGILFLPRPFPLGKDVVNMLQLRQGQGGKGAMPKNLSCDWSTRFMRVIFLGLSLDRTSWQYRRTETGLQYKRTAVQLIQA